MTPLKHNGPVKVVTGDDLARLTGEGWRLLAVLQESEIRDGMRQEFPPGATPAFPGALIVSQSLMTPFVVNTTRYLIGLDETSALALLARELTAAQEVQQRQAAELVALRKQHEDLTRNAEWLKSAAAGTARELDSTRADRARLQAGCQLLEADLGTLRRVLGERAVEDALATNTTPPHDPSRTGDSFMKKLPTALARITAISEQPCPPEIHPNDRLQVVKLGVEASRQTGNTWLVLDMALPPALVKGLAVGQWMRIDVAPLSEEERSASKLRYSRPSRPPPGQRAPRSLPRRRPRLRLSRERSRDGAPDLRHFAIHQWPPRGAGRTNPMTTPNTERKRTIAQLLGEAVGHLGSLSRIFGEMLNQNTVAVARRRSTLLEHAHTHEVRVARTAAELALADPAERQRHLRALELELLDWAVLRRLLTLETTPTGVSELEALVRQTAKDHRLCLPGHRELRCRRCASRLGIVRPRAVLGIVRGQAGLEAICTRCRVTYSFDELQVVSPLEVWRAEGLVNWVLAGEDATAMAPVEAELDAAFAEATAWVRAEVAAGRPVQPVLDEVFRVKLAALPIEPEASTNARQALEEIAYAAEDAA